MHMSGSIGGTSLASVLKLGVPVPGKTISAPMPADFAAARTVAEYTPRVSLTFGARGLPVASLDKTPSEIFDLFSTARSALANTYYVSPTGNDTTGTGTSGAPWRSIWKAVQAANATGQPAKVMVAAGDYGIPNNQVLGNVFPTVDMAFIATGGRVVTGAWADFSAPAADATYPNTYKFTYANCTRVIDLVNVDRDGFFPDLKHVSSPAICNRTPGSWHQDGTSIWLNRADGAAVTSANTRILRSAVAVWRMTSPVSIYMGNEDGSSGFDTQGGYSTGAGLDYRQTTLPASRKAVVVENSTFRYNGGIQSIIHTGNGVGIHDLHGLALFANCDSSNNVGDGFGIQQANVANAKGHMVTVNCRAIKLGVGSGVAAVAQSANAYTLHKALLGVDFAGDYGRAGGGTVRNIEDSLMWAAGSRFGLDHGDAINGGGTPPTAVMMNNNAKCWLDRCEVDVPTGVYGFYVGASAAVRTRNMAPNRTMNFAGGTVEGW